jgi:hypothetical protein
MVNSDSKKSFFYDSMLHLLSAFCHPLFLTWLLALPALTPLFQPTLTRSADGLLHLYRLIALDHLIRQGVFFPRWWPDLAFGYGLPLFVYYAPLSYYLTEGLHLLGFNPIYAFNASAVVALLTAATGMYLLVRDWFGPTAGILAGVAYTYAPVQLFNTFERGSLPVTWAGALFPLAFWSFGRLVKTNQSCYLPLCALTLGAALLMHNISNLLFFPLLLLYLIIALVPGRSQYRASDIKPAVLLRVGLALALALALAAFFWLPATLEREFAQVERVITPPDFDFHANFVTWEQLLALPQPANTGLLNPNTPFTLGLAQVGLALIGLIGRLFQSLWARSQGSSVTPYVLRFTFPPVLFVTLGLASYIFMMLPSSVNIWERLPLLAFVQQPHRLLSVTAFLLAILAGTAVTTWPARVGTGLTVAGICLIFITAVPLLYPRYHSPLPAAPTLTGMLDYERLSGAIGTTSFGEYLPVWVQHIPRESPLEPLYRAGTTIERLDQSYLPAATRVESATYGLNQANLVIDAPQPYQAIFHTFYFPGWQARVDGQLAAIAPVSERGLIGVNMPAGRHELYLYFGETGVRQVANGVSLFALSVVVVLAIKTLNLNHLTHRAQAGLHFQPEVGVILGVLAVVLILAKTLYLDHFDNPLKRTFTGKVAEAEVSRQVNFGDQLTLLGYDLNSVELAPGETFTLKLYWQARQPLNTNYSALAQLIDVQQHLYTGQDNLHPGNVPTTRWDAWGFVQDSHPVRVPPGTPPGDYFLVAGLYDPATWARLPILAGGDPGWNEVIAAPVKVTRAYRVPNLAELGIMWPFMDQTPGVSSIRLLGVTPERHVIRRNDFLRLALFWETITPPTENYQIGLRLQAAAGSIALAEIAPPSFGRYPTSRWSEGERIRDNHALWIPADFPAGRYQLQLQLVTAAGKPLSNWLELGQLAAQP